MINQFSRTSLVLGKDYLKKLEDKVVIIFGIGGVGGNVCDALVRSGIKHFVLVDNDRVNLTNINRQYVANMDTIGELKVDVMERHIKSINKEAIVEKRNCFFLKENADEFDFNKYDYIVDAIDTVSAKIELVIRANTCKKPIISALGCGNKVSPTMLEVTDISKTSYDPLAKVMRKELRDRGINHLKVVYSKEPPIDLDKEVLKECLENEKTSKRSIPGSTAFVPPVAGIIIASEVIKDLLKD